MLSHNLPKNFWIQIHFLFLLCYPLIISSGNSNSVAPPPSLLFGESCSLTGENQATGVQFSSGLQAAFQEINNEGTLPTQLLVQTLDDQYVPAVAYNNTEYFINNTNVFALLGYIGTANADLCWPLAKAAGLPFIGALTGTMDIRVPFQPGIINMRSSYNDETATMVKYIVNDLLLERISIFYQNDSFGLSGLSGLTIAMNQVHLKIYTSGAYVRNTVNVADGVQSILYSKSPPPQAIVMIGTYASIAAFVKACKTQPGFNQDTIFMTLSAVNTETFLADLGTNYSNNVIVTQILPPLSDTNYPIVRDFHASLTRYFPSVPHTFFSFEGYVLGRFVGAVVERMQVNYTRQHFTDVIYQTSLFRVGGFMLGPFFYDSNYNPYAISLEQSGCNQGGKKVWITAYNATLGYFVEISSPMDFYPSCFVDVTTLTSPIVFASISSDSDRASRFERGVLAAFQGSLVATNLNNLEFIFLKLQLPPNGSPQALVQNQSWHEQLIGYIGNEGEVIQHWDFIREEISAGKVFIGAQTGDMSYRSPYQEMMINLRSSIRDEVYALVHYLADNLKMQKWVLVMDASSEAAEAQQVYSNELQAANIEYREVVVVQECNNTLDLFHAAYNVQDPPDVVIFASATSLMKDLSMLLAHRNVWRAYTSMSSWDEVHSLTTLGFNHIYYSAPLPNTIGNTNLPIFTSFVKDYLSKFPEDSSSLNDLLVFEGYLQGMFVAELMTHMDTSNIDGLAMSQELSSIRTIDVGGVQLGTFTNVSCSSVTVGADCECNQGMRSVYIYTINNATPTYTEAVRFDYGTCGILLTPVITTWDSTTTVTNIGVTAFIVGLIGWAFLAKTFIF